MNIDRFLLWVLVIAATWIVAVTTVLVYQSFNGELHATDSPI